MSSTPSNPRHDRGYHGEQSLGFHLGERGYYFIEGPSGAGGHAANARGFDGVAYNPQTNHLIIYDNKSFARAGNITSASAIDPRRNLLTNLNTLINRVQSMHDLPNQSQILGLLRQTRQAVQVGGIWPSNVEIAVSNAGGQSTGVGRRLAGAGIRFIHYYQAPNPVSAASRARAVLSNQNVAAALGVALSDFFQWLGDIGIKREVERRLKTEYSAGIQSYLSQGLGVLVIIRLQEWETPDFNSRRARGLLSVSIEGGETQERAMTNWRRTPRMLPGPPRGWRVLERYAWLPLR